jgi:glycosyltransferase involved in cell wall biosynthesis
LKICMVSYSFYEEDTRILQYTRALIERGSTVDVIAIRREGTPEFEVLNGVNVYRVQTRTVDEGRRLSYLLRILRFLFVSTYVLTKRHLSEPYDVIHVHSVPDFLVFVALIPKLLGAGVILDVHDILPEFYASKFKISSSAFLFKLLLLCEKASAGFSDHVIVANEIWRTKLISRSVSPEKCTAIRNYPDERIFFPRMKSLDNGKFVILYPGTFNRHQGLDVALRAFARVAEAMPDTEFWIYGEGPEKPALLALRESLGLSERVRIEGFLPLNEIADIMASSDLAVVPKRVSTTFGSEAASTKIMEFMSIGVPVIVSRTTVDTYYHGDSMVKFFESENEEDLADAMLLLHRSPDLRKRLVENSWQYLQKHNWKKKKQEYLDLVDSLAPSAASVTGTGVHA